MMKKTENTAFVRCGPLFLLVHGPVNPSDKEVEEILDAYREHAGFEGILLSSAGGGPSSAQRSQIREYWENASALGHPPPTYLMSDSVLTRGALTAISWFSTAPMQAGPYTNFQKVVKFFQLDAQAAQEILVWVKKLHAELGLPPVAYEK